MPGSGVRAANIHLLAEKTGATEFHSSARIATDSKMTFTPSYMSESLTNALADKEEVMRMAEQLKAWFAAISE